MSKPKSSSRRRMPNNTQELQAHNNGLSVWQGLDELLAECNALRVSPSNALLLIRNKELIARAVKDPKGLMAAVQVLDQDIKVYRGKLEAVHAKHVALAQAQNGQAAIGDDVLANILSIAEEYSEWMTSYQLVVIPSAFNVTGFFDSNEVATGIPTPELSPL